MNRILGYAVALAATGGAAWAGIDKGSCSVAGSTLQFCDPAGVACTTSAGETGTCTQRREGCECVPKKTSICHRTQGRVPYNQIDVSNNAVAAHLKHGDCLVDDGNACTRDLCDDQLGCVHTPSDSACDDDVDCTADRCDPTAGCVHVANDSACADDVECTLDQCDSQAGCVHRPDDAACDDESNCTTDICDADIGCTYEPQCATAADCSSDPCIIASCVEGCCAAVDRCPPTTGACRNITGACDEDGGCIEQNAPEGTPCDSSTGGTQCGENGCDGACHDGQCTGTGCPLGTVQLSNGSCAIPCPEGNTNCDGTGCGPHICTQTDEGPVCVRFGPTGAACDITPDCAPGNVCSLPNHACVELCQP